MVGQRPLKPSIMVRVHVPEQNTKTGFKNLFLFQYWTHFKFQSGSNIFGKLIVFHRKNFGLLGYLGSNPYPTLNKKGLISQALLYKTIKIIVIFFQSAAHNYYQIPYLRHEA